VPAASPARTPADDHDHNEVLREPHAPQHGHLQMNTTMITTRRCASRIYPSTDTRRHNEEDEEDEELRRASRICVLAPAQTPADEHDGDDDDEALCCATASPCTPQMPADEHNDKVLHYALHPCTRPNMDAHSW
jgi:hypothetical protein